MRTAYDMFLGMVKEARGLVPQGQDFPDWLLDSSQLSAIPEEGPGRVGKMILDMNTIGVHPDGIVFTSDSILDFFTDTGWANSHFDFEFHKEMFASGLVGVLFGTQIFWKSWEPYWLNYPKGENNAK